MVWLDHIRSGELTATSIRVSDLAPALSRLLRRPVVDKTGLTSRFDIKLEWTPEDTLQPTPDGGVPPASDMVGPSIFTAFQEQLGLRIESQKGPVDILVVDRAERPSEN
jgi:bla regulator protein blaR1